MKRLVAVGTPCEIRRAVRNDPQFLPYLRRHLFILLGNQHAPHVLPWLVENHGVELRTGHFEIVKNHWKGDKHPRMMMKMSAMFLNLKVPIDYHFFHQYIYGFQVLGYSITRDFNRALDWPSCAHIRSEIFRYLPYNFLHIAKLVLLILNRHQPGHLGEWPFNPWTQVKHQILFHVYGGYKESSPPM